MTPSAHFRQHHRVEAPRIDAGHFRPSWRVKTRLDGLLTSGAITPREALASVLYRMHWEFAFADVWPVAVLTERTAAGAWTADKAAISRLDALAQLRELRRRLGDFICDLVESCVVEDCSWAELGRRLRVDPKTARTWTIMALRELAARGDLIARR
jgi:hypothetical protein